LQEINKFTIMNTHNILGIAGMFFIPLLVVLTPIIIGQRYGIWRSKKSENLQNASVGSVVGAAFGLLAFMLAFTFQIAASRYNERKELLLEEVTNIRTTWLRAGVVPEPIRSDTRKLLVEYVDLRIDLANDPSKLSTVMTRSQQILDKFWESVEILAERDRSSEMYSLFTTSVNDLVDNYNQRVTMALEYRFPPAIFGVLSVMAFLSMLALGYQFGISGKGSFRINLLLALIFAMVMFLILALDRPETGLAKQNQKPMLTLQQQLHGKYLNDVQSNK
jgi:ABC-type multidrug transport system fused ATPase/permease subunit